jgi:hypothetical protein
VTLQPQFIFAPRLAGRLGRGELAVEPALGLVRVAGVRRADDGDAGCEASVRVHWRDDAGPGTAAAWYPGERSFLVRMPAYADRLLVRRGIDQAVWHRRAVSDDIARLIASHLDAGPRSGLHRFTIDGSVPEVVYEELEMAARHRPYVRAWVDALGRYFLARQDTRPVPRWTRALTAEAEARAEEWLKAAGVNVGALERHAEDDQSGRAGRYPGLLSRKRIPTETATRLIDAAFLLGMAAARKRTLPAAVQERFREPVMAASGRAR